MQLRGDLKLVTRESDGSYRWTAMHSPVSLHLPAVDDALALAIARATEQDFEVSEQAMSRFRPTADLARLNERVGLWTAVPPRLYDALAIAVRAHRRTRGLFDPRILERLEEYGYLGAPRGAASADSPGQGWLERRPRRREVRVSAPLDLGGIGKGLGVRWGARIARRVTGNFLLNAGGDLLASGSGPEGRGWQVGIEDPSRPQDMIAALHLPRGGAVCTSSVARHRWQHDGQTVHHLIDPRTGRPGGQGLLAVTVVGRDPAWTEVWSKTLFLYGIEGIQAACGSLAAVWVTEDGRLGTSPAARPFVFWRARGETRATP
jgi:thiamine biosynthesis lipoprotein